jgi:predicted NAD-dependent protein-ADP-ribosyltransferase YbiA (DUF1768 family)
MINSFRGDCVFLSNFYMLAVPLPWETLFYPSSEHLFVAYKTMNLEDRVWISTLANPWMAKRAGGRRGYQGRKIVLRPDWKSDYNGAELRVHVMRHVLYLKYTTNPQLIRRLCATHPKQLIEGNEWHDNYWGNCTCPRCVNIPGQNLLGRLHMEHRTNFMMID